MDDRWGHRPVLVGPVLAGLEPRPGQVFCDLTLGAGGHAERLLDAIGPTGRLIAFDRDPQAVAVARERLKAHLDRITIHVVDHREAPRLLEEAGIRGLDGILCDLGVSSMQLDTADRGFAIRMDGPLDMRMSPEASVTAADLVNDAGVAELERIMREYGEEPRARAIARKIVEVRKRSRITRTRELAELVRSVTGSEGRVHPATRVFQSLRIAVNGELEALGELIAGMTGLLAAGGRMAVIAFHSLEDRIVKHEFRRLETEGRGRVLNRKPIGPDESELAENPRARSARLRVFESGGDSKGTSGKGGA